MAVGEFFQSITVGPRFGCMCGQEPCPLWQPLLEQRGSGRSMQQHYEHLFELVHEIDPSVEIVVDESKRIDALREVAKTGAQVDVVRIVRDVRSWTVSTRGAASKRGDRDLRAILKARDMRRLVRWRNHWAWTRFGVWSSKNRRMGEELDETGLRWASLGYEQLATDPEPVMRRLCEQLDLEFHPEMLVPANGIGHLLRGNPSARNPTLQRSIVLSTTFLTDDVWRLPALLRRDVMEQNRRLVYGDGAAGRD
jgi:hypothetical protein